ncbi:MAG: hypothetical protein K2F59_00220 [Eubacteriales bacterium]|nr:hypothetical protein [Eubacteriales bacterium]
MSVISQLDLIILKELEENEKISYIKSQTIYEFKISKVVNSNAIYKRIIKLEKLRYIEKGLKDGKKNTYFITNLGIERLKNI